MWRTNPLQTSIYLFWVNFCKWNTLVPNCLHRRMCMLVSGLKIKLFFPLITLIIVSKILLCRLLGIYVYNANHFDADGNYSQVYYDTTVLEFMTRMERGKLFLNFFLFFGVWQFIGRLLLLAPAQSCQSMAAAISESFDCSVGKCLETDV